MAEHSDHIKKAFYTSYDAEAKAALRLSLFAEQAEKDGYPQLAKLFRAIAESEKIHGKKSLQALREIKSTEENLKASFESETNVAGVAYEKFIRLAYDEKNGNAAWLFEMMRDVEEVHARLYKDALNGLMTDRDVAYFVCPVCGYVAEGEAPDECPVCGAKKEQFNAIE